MEKSIMADTDEAFVKPFQVNAGLNEKGNEMDCTSSTGDDIDKTNSDFKDDTGEINEESQKISFKMPSLPVMKSDSLNKNIKPKEQEIVKVQENTQEMKNFSDEKVKDKTEDKDMTSKLPIGLEKSEKKKSKLSPAEQLNQAQIAIPYKEPSWSGMPEEIYSFEVLKNGSIVANIELDKPFIIFGRLPSCDVTMEHPSLSRHHAVVQYCKYPNEKYQKGVYVYDLDSTHGTWINKNKVYPNKYYRVRVGHILKFGGSTRLHILQGPNEDQEDESDLSVAEMKEQRERLKREAEFLRQAELAEGQRQREEKKAKEEARGCLWGIGEDAEEEIEESAFVNMITPESEALYIDDPKKALNGFFEREGYDLPEYDCQEASKGKYKCTVELPIDTPTGEPMVAEAIVSGKKKEAVFQCALEACRILDKQGLLRASSHESRKRKKKNWEDDDFYDSDEDIFLDRTGDIEKKRLQRMKKAGKSDEKAETYDSLIGKHQNTLKEIADIEAKLEKAKADALAMESEEVDALDAYMLAIKSGAMDTKTKMKLKRQLLTLKQEETKLRHLVNIAKPASLPDLKPVAKLSVNALGSIRPKKFAVQRKPAVPMQFSSNQNSNGDSIVEEDEDVNKGSNQGNSNVESIKDRLPLHRTEITNTEANSDQLCSEKPSKISTVANVTAKQPLMKGPSLPPSVVEDSDRTLECAEEMNVDNDSLESNEDKQKRKRKPRIRQKKPTQESQMMSDYDASDPDFAVWVPPDNQKGDGKTHLNEKYGY